MKRLYIYRDGIQLRSTASRKSAVDLIHQHQAHETHPILRAQFSMIEGAEEFIPYPPHSKEASKTGPGRGTVSSGAARCSL